MQGEPGEEVGFSYKMSLKARFRWGALTSYRADYRYPLFWQGLESLFGADDDTPASPEDYHAALLLLKHPDARFGCRCTQIFALYGQRLAVR